ncbi:hypothetical protein BHK98_00040 [Hornefia porci]|uniref:Transcobalamin-like C-terminal domain-containing protein n=1 Tax=Hornefia porci TaxID=2652292 RepID=A0A1Q9JCG7_9FIRM|nr:hypothetical protein BHK98_00040 [Hornefia porci]
MYKVNGELTDKTLGEMKLQDGDEMVFFYTSDYTAKTAVITFDSDGGSKIAAVTVAKGKRSPHRQRRKKTDTISPAGMILQETNSISIR